VEPVRSFRGRRVYWDRQKVKRRQRLPAKGRHLAGREITAGEGQKSRL